MPPPSFETDEDRLSFAVTIYRHPEFTDSGVINGAINNLSKNDLKIISCMQENSSITKKLISDKTGISARTVDRIISDLKRQNIVERRGPNKNGEWVVN